MNRKLVMIAGSLGACLLTIAAAAQAQPVPHVLENGKLYLRVGTLDTQLLPNLRAQPPEPFQAGKAYVLQLDGPMTAERRTALTQAGVEFQGYLPHFAYIVDLSGAAPAVLQASPFVTWIGEYRNEWKLAPEIGQRPAPFQTPQRVQLEQQGRLALAVRLFANRDVAQAQLDLVGLGAEIMSADSDTARPAIRVIVDAAALPVLAQQSYVQFVEEIGEVRPNNDTVRWIVQSNIPTVTPLYDSGLTGTGQLVGIIDRKVDVNHCSFFDTDTIGPLHRKIESYNPWPPGDPDDHGTFVAAIAVGHDLGANPNTSGVAYGGRMCFSLLDESNLTNNLMKLATNSMVGARIHNNSWSQQFPTGYNADCADYDNFAFNHEDDLILFAPNNIGNYAYCPANAKNVLSVAGSGDAGDQDNHRQGPSGLPPDLRRKPDLCAPGYDITSADAGSSCGTRINDGTSFACPAVAGLAMLIRQYYMEGFYPTGTPTPSHGFIPSGALIKATLINSAVDMTGEPGYPSAKEGWGRVLADGALYFSGDAGRLDVLADVRNANGLSTGQSADYPVTVAGGTDDQLRVTLVWTEPAAMDGAAQAAVNDLDLQVTSPSGELYRGNVFLNRVSVPGGIKDQRNNVEQVHVTSPQTGNWTVTVGAAFVDPTAAIPTQGYALILTQLPGDCDDPEINNSWTGGAIGNPRWSQPGNWTPPFGQPDECHNIFITIQADTVMDRPNAQTPERRVLSLTVSALGETKLGAAYGDPSSELYATGDLKHDSMNEHVMRLGNGDRVSIGDPAADVPLLGGSTSGFRWDIDPGSTGRAYVTVRDKIGCGTWYVKHADLAIGYEAVNAGPLDFALGTIDPHDCPLAEFPDEGRDWTLDSVTLRAKRGLRQGRWTVGQLAVNAPNDFLFDEYFDVDYFTIRSTHLSTFRFGIGDDRNNPPPMEGLRVFQLDAQSAFANQDGPTIETEKLRVLTDGYVILDDGSSLEVNSWDLDDGDAPTGAIFQPRSALRYGHPGSQPVRFAVDMRDFSGRQPKLWFQGDSFISTKLPRAEDPLPQEMILDLQVHLDIEGALSQLPARAWDTATVDVNIRPGSCFDASPIPAQIEAMTADSCNLYFSDIPPEYEPRCLKCWKSLTVGELTLAQEGATLKIVDAHDNHTANAVDCDDPPPAEAMYVTGDINIVNWQNYQALLDLNDLRLYYGGNIVYIGGEPQHTVSPFAPGEHGEAVPLLKTHYGDFDGDCDVDEQDEELFPLRDATPPIVQLIPASNAIFDYDGDCHIGAAEYNLFYARKNANYQVPQGQCNGGLNGVARSCPDPTRAPSGFGQAFFARASAVAQAIAVQICVPQWPNSVAIRITGISANVSCVQGYVQEDGTLDTAAVYQLPGTWGTIRVADTQIVPGADYEVQIEYLPGVLSLPTDFSTPTWGDADGSGVVDVADILCLLDLFGGASIPSCNPGSGDFYPCVPDEVIDISDILAVLDAFAGIQFSDVCPMPCESGLMAPGGGEGAMSEGGGAPMEGGMASGTIRLERAQKTVAVGGLAGVHVFVSDVSELRGWQFALDSLAANGAVFAWEVLTIDDTRGDYVFFGLDDFPATDMTQGRVAAALAGGGVSPSAEKYLGTVWFRVTSLGGGSMTVSLDESHTQLRDSAGQSITVVNLGPVTINIIP